MFHKFSNFVKRIPLVAASEEGAAQTFLFKKERGCKKIMSGVFRVHWNTFEGEHLDEVWLEEISGKRCHRG